MKKLYIILYNEVENIIKRLIEKRNKEFKRKMEVN